MSIDKIDPVWAESGTKTPAPTDEKIQLGWVGGDQPTIEYFNWWMNRADAQLNAQLNYAAGIAVSNLFETGAPVDTDMGCIAYHPGVGIGTGRWVVATTNDNPSLTFYSDDNGKTWSSSTAMNSTIGGLRCAIDTTRFIATTSVAGKVEFSTTSTSWTADTGPSSAGVTGTITCIATKYPDSDFVMIGSTNGEIAYAANVGASWTEGTGPASSDDIIEIVWLGDDDWICIDEDGKTFLSANNGSTWAATTDSPYDFPGASLFWGIDYNATDDVIVAIGDSNIGRSTDGGDTWSNIDFSNLTGYSFLSPLVLKYLGGKTWIALGATSTDSICIVSTDNGSTWEYGNFQSDALPTFYFSSLMFNGNMIMSASDEQVFVSNAVQNLENL